MNHDYRFESLELTNIGVFDQLHIDFPKQDPAQELAEVHIFTGPNGSGKSTLLHALTYELNKDLDHLCQSDPISYNRQCAFLESRFRMEQIHNIKVGLDGHEQAKYIFAINNSLMNQPRMPTPPTQLTNFAFAVFTYSGQRELHHEVLDGIREITRSPFENALSFNQTVNPFLLVQWVANNRTKYALALMDGNTEDAERYQKSLNRITQLINDVCYLNLEFRLLRDPLTVKLKIDGVELTFDGLPDGLKSILSWVMDLTLRLEAIPWENKTVDIFSQPIILLLDEIDIHLHPAWQRRILPAVQKLLPNAQIFVSTHSPFVVGSVKEAWVYRLPDPKQEKATEIIPVHGGAGQSIGLILNEVFGVSEEFDAETEGLFTAFYALKQQLLADGGSENSLLEKAQELQQRGEEVAAIVARELRQIGRILGRELNLV